MDTKYQPHSLYHSVLRVSLVVCAIALVFESGLLSTSTTILSQNTHSYLANAIRMSSDGSIPPADQYTEKESAERTAVLPESESSSAPVLDINTNQRVTFVIAGILLGLLALMVLNYTLDYLKPKKTV